MPAPVRVLALNGSLREGSYNCRLLRAAEAVLPPGAVLESWRELDRLPAYNEDRDGAGPGAAVRRLREAIARADALLVATPEYNATVPGALKNAIDWASRPYPDCVLAGKPAAVVGASTGLFGAVWAQADVRKALRTAGADVVDTELPVATAADAFGPDGGLRSPEQAAVLAELVGELIRRSAAVRS